jgi:hypothetical protein
MKEMLQFFLHKILTNLSLKLGDISSTHLSIICGNLDARECKVFSNAGTSLSHMMEFVFQMQGLSRMLLMQFHRNICPHLKTNMIITSGD